MKRVYILLTVLLCLAFGGQAWAAEPVIQAKGAVLIDGKTGQLLWGKEADIPMPPASTSKILTAITILDTQDISQSTVVSARAAAVGESSMNLRTGEELTLEDLLWGALLHSGNDACYALGEWAGGSESFFVYLLNLKTAAMGGLNASLENTNGLPNDDHLISPYALALSARYALANSTFREMVSTKEKRFGEGSSSRYYKNTNKLLWQDDSVIGVKTGTTNSAGACLVSAMEREGKLLIAVVFNSPDRYGESLKLLNYGLDNFEAKSYILQRELCGYIPVQSRGNWFFSPGQTQYWPIYALNAGEFLYPKDGGDLRLRYRIPSLLNAGRAGEVIGNIVIEDGEGRQWCRVDLELGQGAAGVKP